MVPHFFAGGEAHGMKYVGCVVVKQSESGTPLIKPATPLNCGFPKGSEVTEAASIIQSSAMT